MIISNMEIPTNVPLFYYAVVQCKNSHKRYLKIGSTNRGKKRFYDKDYASYSQIKIIYAKICQNFSEAATMEDLNKSILRSKKGLKWVPHDRFTYFQIPEKLPCCTTFGEYLDFKVQ